MKLTPEKLSAFCTALAETCNVGKACKAVGIARQTAYEWKHEIPSFSEAWDKAMAVGVTALEDEAHRRAFEGTEDAIYHKGQLVGTTTRYSDTLAIFLLKAHAPDKYKDRQATEHSGGVSLTVSTGVPSDEGDDLV